MSRSAAFPDGHFYSPVVDPEALSGVDLWGDSPTVLGVDFNHTLHLEVLDSLRNFHIQDFDYPHESACEDDSLNQFYIANSQFGFFDSIVLFYMMRHYKPSRIVEVGSGYSSLLMADVNNRFLEGVVEITCIEPFPRDFLKNGVPGISRLVEKKVQDVPLSFFSELQAGDFLFIDSSHVCKTGSDVNYLYFEVLPRLAKGVMIHIHDIFLPYEYPKNWVLSENRSWNEQYVLRALLMYSVGFNIVFGCSYASFACQQELSEALQGAVVGPYESGSLWLQRT